MLRTCFVPVFSDSGEPLRIVGSTQDITDRKLGQEKIQKSEALLLQTEQLANLGSWEWDLETGAITWSDNMFRIRGFAPREAVLTPEFCSQVLNPPDREFARNLLAKAISSRQPQEHEYRCTLKDGRLRVFRTCFAAVFSESGKPLRIVGATQDVTDRRNEENRLRRSEALLDQAEEIAGFGCWECDLSTGVIVLSKNLRKMYGFPSSDDWNAERYWDNVLRSDRAALRQAVRDAIAQCKPFEYVTRYRMPDGTVRIYHVRGAPVAAAGDSAVSVRGVVHDITSQTRSEEDLRRLSQELLRTQDAERRQIARNLHESAGQTLAAMKMTLANLEEALRENKEDVHGHLQAARGLAEDAIREVRVLSYLMHPPMLDEAGLGPTIQWYAKGFSERSGIETTIESGGNFGRLPQQVETTVFRIVQEALTNVHRYSGSRTATIRLNRNETEVRIEVQDQGCGLQPHAPGRHARLGVGIAGMRERVKQLDGAFEIESIAGRGTTVRAALPIVSRASPESDPESAPLPGDTAPETTKGASAPPALNV